MSIKSIEREVGCFAKAAEDEPLFVLRAKDKFAPLVIRYWADLVDLGIDLDKSIPVDTVELMQHKAQEARKLADDMDGYQFTNGAKLPD